MLRSALPFGTSLLYLLLFGSIVAGGGFLLVGLRWKSTFLMRSGLVLTMTGIGLLSADAYFSSLMDWNPVIESESQVLGTWADEREAITLHADHRVDYHSWNEGFSGTWSLNDWNLMLKAEGVDSEMRFVRYGGELRLMTNPPDDLDAWNGTGGLIRVGLK